MPVARYFLFVGGVLLALLFLSNEVLPKLPVEADRAETGPHKSVIRIQSDRKWPERVVFDTNLPTIVPPRNDTGQCSSPDHGRRRFGQVARAAVICRAQAVRTEEAGAQAQNRKSPRGPADGAGRPAAAIWFFCQQYLVSQLAGALGADRISAAARMLLI
jgi:hypothetical protein